MRRLLLVAVVFTFPVSVISVAFAGPAAAQTNVLCGKLMATSLTATSLTMTGTISRCTDPADTGGSGTFKPAGAPTRIKWNSSEHTDMTWAAWTIVSPNACHLGWTEYQMTGTAGTGTALSIPPGSILSALVCYNSPNIKLLAGIDLTIT
jgi:hypothetical protein